MKARTSASLWVAGMLVLGGAAASAQSAGQPPAPPSQPPAAPQSQPSARPSSDQEMTITGCIQKEADYRAAKDAGKGGAAGTGAGVGNEFILAQASPASADPATPTGTSGSSMAFELTGPNEGQVSQYVGKRVEIKGKVKAAETSASGRPTGGATAGAPPAGVDVASKDLQLRELEITSVKEASGSCAPAK